MLCSPRYRITALGASHDINMLIQTTAITTARYNQRKYRCNGETNSSNNTFHKSHSSSRATSSPVPSPSSSSSQIFIMKYADHHILVMSYPCPSLSTVLLPLISPIYAHPERNARNQQKTSLHSNCTRPEQVLSEQAQAAVPRRTGQTSRTLNSLNPPPKITRLYT